MCVCGWGVSQLDEELRKPTGEVRNHVEHAHADVANSGLSKAGGRGASPCKREGDGCEGSYTHACTTLVVSTKAQGGGEADLLLTMLLMSAQLRPPSLSSLCHHFGCSGSDLEAADWTMRASRVSGGGGPGAAVAAAGAAAAGSG